MTVYLSFEDSLRVAHEVLEARPEFRDVGLLESALARPRTTVFGADAYEAPHQKAAALLQSIVRNHPLVDGNKRLGFACATVFLHVNGHPLTLDDDNEAYDLVIAVATGRLSEVDEIARAFVDPSRIPDES